MFISVHLWFVRFLIASLRSADFQSAGSPVCNLRGAGMKLARRFFQRPANCKSAKQPIKNPRYVGTALLVWLLAFSTTLAEPAPPTRATHDAPTVFVVVGAPGEAEFATNFVKQADLWEKVCEQANAKRITIGLDEGSPTNDLERLRLAFEAEPRDGPAELWLVLIGHGTFDGQEAKFNLRGPDLAATNLALWLKPFHRPVAVINTASASAPFIKPLSGTNRVIVTATRSGNESNFARFGQFFAAALADPPGDLDQDGQNSLLEAFLSAATRVAEFYKTAGRLATEHALIDDNGDGLGTPADWFRGTRATKKARDGGLLDGVRAHQLHLVPGPDEQALSAAVRSQRDALELALARLRETRPAKPDDDYYRQLEVLLVELGRLYDLKPAAPAP